MEELLITMEVFKRLDSYLFQAMNPLFLHMFIKTNVLFIKLGNSININMLISTGISALIYMR